jgi:hypothetical protein
VANPGHRGEDELIALNRIGGFLSLVFFLAGVATAPAQSQSNGHFYIANLTPPDDFLALRSLPSSKEGYRITVMPKGTLVDVIEQRGDGWWKVRVVPSGQQGWALSGVGQRQWIVCCQTETEQQQASTEDTAIAFRTPSGNIDCLATSTQGFPNFLRCDLVVIENVRLQPIEACNLNSGDAFGIEAGAAVGVVVCHGDTVIQQGSRVLSYGQSWQGLGFTCQSDQKGLTCSNEQKHGFFVSRTSQRVF